MSLLGPRDFSSRPAQLRDQSLPVVGGPVLRHQKRWQPAEAGPSPARRRPAMSQRGARAAHDVLSKLIPQAGRCTSPPPTLQHMHAPPPRPGDYEKYRVNVLIMRLHAGHMRSQRQALSPTVRVLSACLRFGANLQQRPCWVICRTRL